MKISTRQVDGVTIVDCSGRITLGEGSVTLRETVTQLLGKGEKKILLNLGDVNYIDSSGIGELVSAFTTVRKPASALTFARGEGQTTEFANRTVFRPTCDRKAAPVKCSGFAGLSAESLP